MTHKIRKNLIAVLGLVIASPVFAVANSASPITFNWNSGNHFYVGAGVDAYQLGIQKITSEVSVDNDKFVNIARFNKKITPQLNGNIGYNFGSKVSLDLKYSWLNENTSNLRDLANDRATVRKIDNGAPVNAFATLPVRGTVVDGSFNNQQAEGRFLVHLISKSKKWNVSPYVGFIVNRQAEEVDTNTDFSVNPAAINMTATTSNVSSDLLSQYFGPSVGSDLSFRINNQNRLNANAEFDLLNAHSRLLATQRPDTRFNANQVININDSKDFVEYRGVLSASFDHALFNRQNSPYFSLTAGLDLWGRQPGIQMPDATEGIHIAEHDALNKFIGASVVVPLVT